MNYRSAVKNVTTAWCFQRREIKNTWLIDLEHLWGFGTFLVPHTQMYVMQCQRGKTSAIITEKKSILFLLINLGSVINRENVTGWQHQLNQSLFLWRICLICKKRHWFKTKLGTKRGRISISWTPRNSKQCSRHFVKEQVMADWEMSGDPVNSYWNNWRRPDLTWTETSSLLRRTKETGVERGACLQSFGEMCLLTRHIPQSSGKPR